MPRILLADPSPEIRELLAHVVSGLGFEPVLVSGADGERLPDVDVVVLEPGLPGGVELIRRLRARLPELPVVCVSIYPATPEVAALEPLVYLVKPFSLAALQAAIEQAVRRASVIA